jgi:crotonobetainyl-CoA:carnitine CoA-transferase CaiB-like acyl-CoA transferase
MTAGLTTRQLRPAAPDTATGVAATHLDLLGLPRWRDSVRLDIDWAGPIDLPLTDETTVQAACGLMHVHGRATGTPTPLAVDFAGTVAGVLGAQGVLAALVATARGLPTTSVRTSVGQAALLAVSQYLAAATCDDCTEDAAVTPEPGAATPPFTSADGVRFEIEALDAETWQRFWLRVGAEQTALRRGWPVFQQRFATAVCPLPTALFDAVRRLDLAAITAVGAASGMSVVPVREEPSEDGPPWRFAPLSASARGLGIPTVRPLDGIVVVESTRRVQGPLAGHLLRMLGAEVIRIEPPGGDPLRWVPPVAGGVSARFAALNAGKQVVEIDLAGPGRDVVLDLVRRADVFLHNWAPGRAARWGLGADDLAAVRPGLVHAWASGWGDRLGAHPPLGTDYLVQAHSGLAAALRPSDALAAPTLLTATDVLGGLVCAQGVLAALLTRLHTGRGSGVDSSLLSAAGVVPRPVRPSWTELDVPLRTADGYLALSSAAARRPDRVAAALATIRLAAEPTAVAVESLAAAGLAATAVTTDFRALATDPRFTRALTQGQYIGVGTPWEFG